MSPHPPIDPPVSTPVCVVGSNCLSGSNCSLFDLGAVLLTKSRFESGFKSARNPPQILRAIQIGALTAAPGLKSKAKSGLNLTPNPDATRQMAPHRRETNLHVIVDCRWPFPAHFRGLAVAGDVEAACRWVRTVFFCSTLGVRDGLWLSSYGRALSAVGLSCFCLRRARASAKISSPSAGARCVFLGAFCRSSAFGIFFGAFVRQFAFTRWRRGKRLLLLSSRVEFCCLVFWGHAMVCGAFVLFGFCLFGKKLLSSWRYLFLFRVGLAQFFVGMSIN